MASGARLQTRHASLNRRLVTLFLIVGLLPLLLAGPSNFFLTRGTLVEQVNNRLTELAAASSDKLDRTLFDRYADVQAFSSSDAARSMDPLRITPFMARSVVTYAPAYRLMMVADRDGNIIAANTARPDGTYLDTAGLLGESVSSEAWFKIWHDREYQPGTAYVEDVHGDPRVGQLYGDQGNVIGFSYGIFNQSGGLIGVWLNLYDWNAAQTALREFVARPQQQGAQTLSLTIVSKDGMVLASDTSAVAGQTRFDLTASGGRMVQVVPSTGYSAYKGLGWQIVASQSSTEALGIVRNLSSQALVVALLSTMSAVVIGILAARAIIRPIRALQTAAEQVAAGDLQAHVPTGADEIGQLGRAFNSMIDQLRASHSGLEDKVAARTAELETTLTDLQRSTTEQQRLTATVEALSIPIIPITKTVLAVPLVGRFDEARIALLVQRILKFD